MSHLSEPTLDAVQALHHAGFINFDEKVLFLEGGHARMVVTIDGYAELQLLPGKQKCNHWPSVMQLSTSTRSQTLLMSAILGQRVKKGTSYGELVATAKVLGFKESR